MSVLFDDSLPTLIDALIKLADVAFVEKGTVLRDATGRLTFFAPRAPISADERNAFESGLKEKLGVYVHQDRPIVFSEDTGARQTLSSPERMPIRIGEVFCWLLDRRIVGTGWLDNPASRAHPPRVAFATLKGGVGRSTALVVAAMDLAARNRDVLVIDLDLEAPGLGELMLDEDRMPQFGAIDYLVENGLQPIGIGSLSEFIGTSTLTMPGGGRVDVLPAFGKRCADNPENVLPKLARAMIEDVDQNKTVSVSEQISNMIVQMSSRAHYDVVLIDSRAGLSELAAPAVIGLGATVLLFGTAQRQTIEGYRSLFSALQLLAQRDAANGRDSDWRTMFRPVYAKASMNAEVGNRFRDEVFELYSAHLYDVESIATTNLQDELRFIREDESAPHWPIVIPFSQNFVDFDPGRLPGQLTQDFYEQTFRPFLNELDAIIESG